MGKVINLADKHIELLNDDIKFYLAEIGDFLLDEFFESILNVILKKMNNEEYNFLDELIEFVNVMESNKNLIAEEDFSILMALKDVIENLLSTYYSKLKIMSLSGLVVLWIDPEKEESGLILNKEVDVYDSLMIINRNLIVSQREINKMQFKYIVDAKEFGTFEEVTEFITKLIDENKEISPEDVIRRLKKE